MQPKNMHMLSEVSDAFCWPLYPDLARLEDLHNIACDSDIFPENSRRQKLKYDRIEIFTSRNQHSGTVNDANQHGPHFFSLLNAVVWI
jgi:hypothetical protein